MQEKIDFSLISEFKTAVANHHVKPIHTMWKEHPSLRSLFMGKQVVVFNPNTRQDELYQLPFKELLFYFHHLLLLSTPFSAQIVKDMWGENLLLPQLFCGRSVPQLNPNTNQQEPFKITFAEVLENFKSASLKDADIALVLWNDNAFLRAWLKGQKVSFFNSNTEQSTMRQIDGNELLIHFKCVLRSRKQELINFMWANNEFLFATIKALSFEESLSLLEKVMKSSNKGNSVFIQKYLQLITNYEVIKKALDNINPDQSFTHRNLAALLNARLAQLPIPPAPQEQMDLNGVRNLLRPLNLGSKNSIIIEKEYHGLLKKYKKEIGIASIIKVRDIEEELYEVTFDMTIFPYFLNNVAIPKRAAQQAPQYPEPSSFYEGEINFHETVALKVPSQQQNTMPHPLMSTHASSIETNIPDRAINGLSSNFHHPMDGWQGVYQIHRGAMLHQMMPTEVSSTHVYPPIGAPLWNSSTATTTNTFTSNANLIQQEAFSGPPPIDVPEQQTMNINNVSLTPVSPDRSLSSGVTASNNNQVNWNTTSSFTPLAQKRTMTSNESLAVAKKRKTMELNVSGGVEEFPALPQQPFIAEPTWHPFELFDRDFQSEGSGNDLGLPSQDDAPFYPVITTHQQIKENTTTSNEAKQKTILPIEAPQQSPIPEESSALKENYEQYYLAAQFGTVECEVNLESLREMDESGWNNVCNSSQNDMLSSSMLNHIGFFGVPQSSQETKQTKQVEQKIKDINSP